MNQDHNKQTKSEILGRIVKGVKLLDEASLAVWQGYTAQCAVQRKFRLNHKKCTKPMLIAAFEELRRIYLEGQSNVAVTRFDTKTSPFVQRARARAALIKTASADVKTAICSNAGTRAIEAAKARVALAISSRSE